MSMAFDIYAKSLSKSGFGLPMWCPEPSLETGEIRLGDVGIMRDGIFVCLFNTLVPADDPINARRGVPEGFEPIDSLYMNQTSSITQQLLYSSGIESIDGTSSGYGCASGAQQGWGRCGGPATCQITHSRRRIADYMHRHLCSWMAFAYHQLGLKVREQELLFISGTAKTTSWLNVAFSKGDSKGVLSIRRDGGELSGGGELRVSMSEATNSSVFARAGPASTPGAGSEELPANQCIFVNYFRVKKRAWRSVIMKAAAGAHQLDYPPDDDPSPLRTFNLESESTSDLEVCLGPRAA
ncbi:hypothetical protein OH76DRAFT_1352076 [Lentinus brumalis]|uniref:Uncharacterized protein n=1 Tax=Lentinus brumalis TaxID=2498619 RepID=A0A371D7Y3_9APHY|nr:hypothetical protein OH76DRAFT_1352076 [Polyporus brumalis]